MGSDAEEEDRGSFTIVIPQTIRIKKRYIWAALAIVMILMAFAPVAAAFLGPSQSSGAGGNPVPSSGGNAPTVNCPNPCTISIRNSVFGSGQTVVVAKGTQVIWANNDDTTHTSTSNSGLWDTGIVQIGKSAAPVTFNSDGVFPYFCNVHPMTGVIEVVG